jgi:hypothetical protein
MTAEAKSRVRAVGTNYWSGNLDADLVIVKCAKNLSKTDLLRRMTSSRDYEFVADLQD